MRLLIQGILLGAGLGLAVMQASGQPGPRPPRNRRLDSLQTVLRNHPAADSARVILLYNISEELTSHDPTKGQAEGAEALALAQRLGYRRGVGKVYRLLGRFNSNAGKYDAALHALRQAQAIFQQLRDTFSLAGSLSQIGGVYSDQGNYEKAVVAYNQALTLAEQRGDVGSQKSYAFNLGGIYGEMGQYEKAINIFQQHFEEIYDLNRNPDITCALYQNLATCYEKLGQYAKAQRYADLDLKEARQAGLQAEEADALLLLGQLEADQHRVPASLPYLTQALALMRRLAQPDYTAKALLALGDSWSKLGRNQEANRAFTEAAQLAEQVNDKPLRQEAYRGLATVDAKLGNYQAAYRYQALAAAWQDSVLNEASLDKITTLQVRYETEHKDAQNRLLQKQKQLQQAQLQTQQQVIRRRNVQLWAGLAVAALLAGLAYLLYNRRRLRREVEFAQERQLLERLRAQAVLEAEEAERRRIGSDLHDGVGQLLTAATLNLHSLGEELGVQTEGQQSLLQNALAVVEESFSEVRSISHNLMPNALIKRGLAQAVRDFLDKLPSAGRVKINLEVVGLDRGGRLEPTMENVLFRVIQELVQNILKHAQATEVTLQIIRHPEELTVLVEDNGLGFDPAALGEDAGIGLKNIESRMAYLGGRVDFDAAPGRGTTVTLEVPLATVVE